MKAMPSGGIRDSDRRTIASSETGRMAFCIATKLPFAVNDASIGKELVRISWMKDSK